MSAISNMVYIIYNVSSLYYFFRIILNYISPLLKIQILQEPMKSYSIIINIKKYPIK